MAIKLKAKASPSPSSSCSHFPLHLRLLLLCLLHLSRPPPPPFPYHCCGLSRLVWRHLATVLQPKKRKAANTKRTPNGSQAGTSKRGQYHTCTHTPTHTHFSAHPLVSLFWPSPRRVWLTQCAVCLLKSLLVLALNIAFCFVPFAPPHLPFRPSPLWTLSPALSFF